MKKSKRKANTSSIPLASSQFGISDNRKTKENKRHKKLSKVRKGR